LTDALAFQNRNPDLLLAFATSMGQAAVHRSNHEGFGAAVTDLFSLLKVFDMSPEGYAPLLAMVPQVAAAVPDTVQRTRLCKALRSARTASGKAVFHVDEVGTTVSITIITPCRADKDHGGFTRQDETVPGRFVPWAEAGITMHPIEAGTAYHVPEGILALVGHGIVPSATREQLEATAVKSLLMDHAGLKNVNASIPVAVAS
jgi:hypothetical protein